MSLDNFKNFAKVTVSLGYDAAATSIVLQSGDAAKLPTAPFNATWWDGTTFSDPTDDSNKEVIRVTTVTSSNDTLTIVRAQESTSAATHNTSGKVYKLIVGLTAKTLNTDIPATFTAYNSTMTTAGGVAYVSAAGTITEDDTNFHWDSSNHRLGLGTNAPQSIFETAGQIRVMAGAGAPSSGAGVELQYNSVSKAANLYGFDRTGGTAVGLNLDGDPCKINAVTTPNKTVFIGGPTGVGTGTPAAWLHVVDNTNGGGMVVDGGSNPGIWLKSGGSIRGYIGIPTTANAWLTDSTAGDIVHRVEAGNLIETVNAATNATVRRMVRPAKILTSTATQTTTMFSCTCAANTVAGGRIDYAVEVVNSTSSSADVVCQVGQFWWSVANNATFGISVTGNQVTQCNNQDPSVTTTITWAISTANPAVITCAITSSFTPATNYPKVTCTMENFTRQAIAPA